MPKALDCLQRQTFENFEAIISVDGGDTETADACRPFLSDRRFRMVVHPKRLDWVGNFNWLLQQDSQEFFCYRQHDDTTAPEFFEALLKTADKESHAAAIYCDCQFSGMSNSIEIARSIEGEPLDRMFQYIVRLPNTSAAPVRGLIRKAAIRQAGLVRSDEFRAALQLFGWLGRLLHWGNFRRVAKPLYYRMDHARSFTREYFSGTEDWKLAVWTTMFTGLLDAALPLCSTPRERLFFQQIIFDRIVAYPTFHPSDERGSTEKIIAGCLARLQLERNTHLLDVKELPPVLQGLQTRVDKMKSIERSRVGRGIHQIIQRHRFAKLIHPRSRKQRLAYEVRHLLDLLGRQIEWMLGY